MNEDDVKYKSTLKSKSWVKTNDTLHVRYVKTSELGTISSQHVLWYEHVFLCLFNEADDANCATKY